MDAPFGRSDFISYHYLFFVCLDLVAIFSVVRNLIVKSVRAPCISLRLAVDDRWPGILNRPLARQSSLVAQGVASDRGLTCRVQ